MDIEILHQSDLNQLNRKNMNQVKENQNLVCFFPISNVFIDRF
jgi:hypothetical protein